ncbi:MAG: FAD:protein FMN transferase [Bacteroidia bacterium]|nr:FAD:protein FMN transferase [Bacteroidia bacterium]NND53285.1 FAD:protein FMN transferase [Flavobacteriaceae bacterium]
MGSNFELCVVHHDPKEAELVLGQGIEEIGRIEALLTEYSSTSFTYQINENSGIRPIEVPQEVFQLIERSKQISRLTEGHFDISVGPLKKIYRFKKTEFQFPSKKEIREALSKTGYTYITTNPEEQSVFLNKPNMHISFAAIGKGYAADAVKKLWLESGVENAYINASGDLTAFGTNEKNSPWKIGIANPDRQEEILFYVPLNEASVATSGDYEQHFICDGKRYSHNINPKTGLPLSGIKSVSVFSPSAELSDALATAVYAMGRQKGILFVDQLPKTHVIIIDENNDVYFSKNLNYEAVT